MIVQSPDAAAGTQLRRIAAETAGVVVVARLGSATLDDAMAARRLMEALGLHALGLVITCSPAESAEITRAGFGVPARPRARSRAGSPNGSHAAAESPHDEPAARH